MVCSCAACGYRADDFGELSLHFREVHDGPRVRIVCPEKEMNSASVLDGIADILHNDSPRAHRFADAWREADRFYGRGE